LVSSCCFFCANSPLSSPVRFFADDEIVKVHSFYGNMSWWSITCEELGIITSCSYIIFSSLTLALRVLPIGDTPSW
jgi:hypothetical protein